MTYWKLFFLPLLLVPLTTFSSPRQKDVLEETLYQEIKSSLMASSFLSTGVTPLEQKLFVDVLTELLLEKRAGAFQALDLIPDELYNLTEKFRINLLRMAYGKTFSPLALSEARNELLKERPSKRLVYLVLASRSELLNAGFHELVTLAERRPEFFNIRPDAKDLSNDVLQDLFYRSPELNTVMNGEYKNGIKIFMFCRKNRHWPCLMIMRDSENKEVRNSDGTLWVHPALGSSKFDIPSHKTNGDTPAGLHTIDSVMPVADEQVSFGKFRRMILNFIPASKDESLLKSLLPESSHTETWWKPSVVARDVGRSLLRIHGTGKRNSDPASAWYPFLQTSGCISQRENTYDNVTYKDQRDLLDQIMLAMKLKANFENEVNVKGILHLVEIDNKEAPVGPEDLKVRGIE